MSIYLKSIRPEKFLANTFLLPYADIALDKSADYIPQHIYPFTPITAKKSLVGICTMG